MTRINKSTALLLGALAALTAQTVPGADTITAVHAFPAPLVYSKSFLGFVEEINKRGQGVLEIAVKGGPEAIGMFEQPQAVRDGVVDMVHTPGSFYGASVPEIDAMVAASVTPMEARKNGGAALMDQVHQQRFNVRHLGWIDGGIGFHIYMTKEPKFGPDGVIDLNGVTLRDNPIYHAFFEALNATTASMKSTEVYSALEKGVVDASAWTSIGIPDLKWDKFVKYRVDPRFYRTDLGVIINLDTWKALSDESKTLLDEVIVEWEEKSFSARAEDREREAKQLQEGGMTFVSMAPDAAKKYVQLSVDAAWGRMKERLDKMGGAENYEQLRALYAPQ